jgi:acetyltransferase-like isoleucine patch superfamily enzyme
MIKFKRVFTKIFTLNCRAIIVLMPWPAKKFILRKFFGFQFGEGSYIAPFSWIFPRVLCMGDYARIGSLTVAVHLDRIEMGENASIGRGNWITGHPHGGRHYSHREGRDSALILGRHSAITKSHTVDCTDRVTIGSFTTIAGYASQFITHGIDVNESRQDCKPIEIGSYCLIGTRAICLGGGRLPDRSILGAGSTLTRSFEQPDILYAGCPARAIKPLAADARYFVRETGFVW